MRLYKAGPHLLGTRAQCASESLLGAAALVELPACEFCPCGPIDRARLPVAPEHEFLCVDRDPCYRFALCLDRANRVFNHGHPLLVGLFQCVRIRRDLAQAGPLIAVVPINPESDLMNIDIGVPPPTLSASSHLDSALPASTREISSWLGVLSCLDDYPSGRADSPWEAGTHSIAQGFGSS